jgi:uncharacterized protein (DUF4415 family)
MNEEYDFTNARRGAVLPAGENKVRITIRLDQDIINWFKARVESQGGGNYQTMINQVLQGYIDGQGGALEELLRKVVREELARPH